MFATNSYDVVGLTPATRLSGRTSDRSFLAENELDFNIARWQGLKCFTSRFRWEGESIAHLPQGYIERWLYQVGRMVMYLDKDLGVVILPANVASMNYFFEPASFTVLANGYNHTLSTLDCVELRENPSAVPPVWEVERSAQVIADARRSLQNQITALKKTNVMLVKEDAQKGGGQEIMSRWVDNCPTLTLSMKALGIAEFDEKALNSVFLPLNKSANDGSLQATLGAMKTLFNEMLASQGINTNMLAKSQYRSEMEIEGDTSHVELILRQADNQRQVFCRRVKEKFGIDIKCVNVYKEAGDEANDLSVGNEQPNKADDTKAPVASGGE